MRKVWIHAALKDGAEMPLVAALGAQTDPKLVINLGKGKNGASSPSLFLGTLIFEDELWGTEELSQLYFKSPHKYDVILLFTCIF